MSERIDSETDWEPQLRLRRRRSRRVPMLAIGLVLVACAGFATASRWLPASAPPEQSAAAPAANPHSALLNGAYSLGHAPTGFGQNGPLAAWRPLAPPPAAKSPAAREPERPDDLEVVVRRRGRRRVELGHGAMVRASGGRVAPATCAPRLCRGTLFPNGARGRAMEPLARACAPRAPEHRTLRAPEGPRRRARPAPLPLRAAVGIDRAEGLRRRVTP